MTYLFGLDDVPKAAVKGADATSKVSDKIIFITDSFLNLVDLLM
jgi:hypothetical protein